MALIWIIFILGSIYGVFTSAIIVIFSAEDGWIALLIIALIFLIGSIFGFSRTAIYKRKLRRGNGEINRRLWLLIAIFSFIGALIVFFSLVSASREQSTFIIIYVAVSIFLGLSLYSIYMLSSTEKTSEEKEIKMKHQSLTSKKQNKSEIDLGRI